MRTNVRSGRRRLTHTAISIASAMLTGMVPIAYQALFSSTRQKTSSSSMNR